MSHTSDKSLSQPLRVDTEDNNTTSNENGTYFEEVKENYNQSNPAIDDSLGPLPPKWEKAYTESGEVYFIDHSTGTSHWLDPRLSKFQKKCLEDCLDDELPYGWEKISDPHYGTYFIDHVNRKTQYENPVIQAKRAASRASARVSTASFTKDPSELCGQRFRTSLVKSSRGLGFTIVGGDDAIDEFLQIKSVVPKGPAWLDGKLQMGDIIVYVNDTCVLGYTHNQIVRLFQSISVGSTVAIEVCRGYQLPFDPNDPNTEVVTTIAVDSNLQTLPNEKCLGTLDTNYNFLDADNINDDLDGTNEIDDLLKGISVGKVEVRVRIVKGTLGFGFTIADSACGQRVKKILDRQRCKNLMEGDILLEINDVSLQNMTHDEVVLVLKNCPFNNEATICVQRGAATTAKSPPNRNRPRKLDNRFGNKDGTATFRSKTPTADIYSTQPREILPSRPKTPIVDTRNISKTSPKDVNSNSELYKRDYVNENFQEKSHMCLSLADNHGGDEEELEINNIIQNNHTQEYHTSSSGMYMALPHRFDCLCYNCQNHRGMIENNTWRVQPPCDYMEYTVTLHRQETGFGFRIVGGIEDQSQVAVGHIVQDGAADLDGRIRSGDEIICVDNLSVVQASHRLAVKLVNVAATRGQVVLVLRRRLCPPIGGGPVSPTQPAVTDYHPQTYDVVVNRNENEGFGFVIISSVNKAGSTIGRLIEDSPAERCGRLRVGDYILAVNHIDIMHLSHGDIVNLIKDSGLSVTLTITPNTEQ
ncbi:membrane-associated guanylate kinase, WW and PDZ domain-containing protein 1 [Onthophagus taurus]|uniref:membrane-associated guanylate kinase, WW and PDZ domain-containing protein 1 n=1 Tax=Onthophagus taurus TaxID=166361 RepID=UPI000C202244|nr:membrane-associated guanylate kinase, WW and PDZ domain-containing protein 1 [Onthophagus taurus]